MTLDEVLDAFALEAEPDKATLEQYLKKFPQFAPDLIDLASELTRTRVVDTSPLSIDESNLVEAAWRTHAATHASTDDPLALLGGEKSRELSRVLGVPRQLITAFRERRVLLSSVPERFLTRFADALKTGVEELTRFLSHPVAATARSYRSDAKPAPPNKATFEQLLIEARVPDDRRNALLAGEE